LRYRAFAEILLDLRWGDFARNIGCGAAGFSLGWALAEVASEDRRQGSIRGRPRQQADHGDKDPKGKM